MCATEMQMLSRSSRLRILQIPGDAGFNRRHERVEDVFRLARERGEHIRRRGETTRSNFLSFHDKFLRA